MGTSKQLLKDIAKLKMHKFREMQNKFVVEGDKLVVEAIQSIPQSVLQIFVTPETKISSKELEKFNVFEISSADLEKISTQKSPQHSLAIIDSSFQPTETKNVKLVLACDDIQDPGNFGTIIRTADWFGISRIVASRKTVDVFNQKVIQASMGSVFRVPVEYVDLKSWLINSERRILGAVLNGTSIFDYKVVQESVIIIGNEGKGISQEISELIQDKITIPAIGRAESLNAAVATGIIVAELTKKITNG
jgi:TrmH family RNA methyltransferase